MSSTFLAALLSCAPAGAATRRIARRKARLIAAPAARFGSALQLARLRLARGSRDSSPPRAASWLLRRDDELDATVLASTLLRPVVGDRHRLAEALRLH